MKPILIERQHGQQRLQGQRARELKPPPGPARSAPNGKRARPNRPAFRSLFAEVRAAAASEGVGDAAVLARRAMSLYRAAAKEHHTTSLTARTHLLGWALQSAVAQHLTLRAGGAGLDTEHGLRLIERAGKCQGRASQAWVAAVSAAGLLDGSQPTSTADQLAALMREAGQPRVSPLPPGGDAS